MTGRAEVFRLQQRLDAAFARVSTLPNGTEMQSDFSRYLCVLVSGFLEKSAYELVLEHARRTGHTSLQRFVDKRTRRFANAKSQKLMDLLGDFDPVWRLSLETFVVDERKDAINSIVDLRNKIAHGQSVGITFQTVSRYYAVIKTVVDHIADLCVPNP